LPNTLLCTIDCNLRWYQINVLLVGGSGLVFQMPFEFVSWRFSKRCLGCRNPGSSFRTRG